MSLLHSMQRSFVRNSQELITDTIVDHNNVFCDIELAMCMRTSKSQKRYLENPPNKQQQDENPSSDARSTLVGGGPEKGNIFGVLTYVLS